MASRFYLSGLLIVVSYLGVGVMAWRLRPRNRTGPLMVAIAVAYGVGMVGPSVPSARFLHNIWLGLLAQLVFALPTGRLNNPLNRILVACAWCDIVLITIRSMLQPPLFRLLAPLEYQQQYIVLVLGVAFVAGQVVQWRRSSLPQRRLIAPMLAGCLVVVGLLVLDQPSKIGGLAFRLALPLIPIAYLVGLLRQHLDRAGVAGLVVRLGNTPRVARLSEELAATLHDPTLRLGFWVSASGDYVDATGQPMPPAGDDQVVSRIDRDGRRIAMLVHDRALLDEPELVRAACAATALALENERLQADLRARLHELAASRTRLVHATEAGRRRLERDLHDGVQQKLLAAAMMLGRAEHSTDQTLVTEAVAEAKSTVLATLDELRALCQGIHPPVLTERGLAGALRELADTAPIGVDLTVAVDGELSPDAESVAYYVAAEALTNVIKHADTTDAAIRVHRRGTRLVVRVRDDGRGGATPSSSGLAGLRDRVEAMGGELTVTSPVGAGTTILAELPCEPGQRS